MTTPQLYVLLDHAEKRYIVGTLPAVAFHLGGVADTLSTTEERPDEGAQVAQIAEAWAAAESPEDADLELLADLDVTVYPVEAVSA